MTLCGLAVVIYEVHQSKKAHVDIFNKQRVISTFEFYNKLRSEIREIHQDIISELTPSDRASANNGFDILTDEQTRYLLSTDGKPVRKRVRDILSLLERLACGIKYEVYDEKIIYDLSSTQMTSYLGYYLRYIIATRTDTPEAYSEFLSLADRIHRNQVTKGKKSSHMLRQAIEEGVYPISR